MYLDLPCKIYADEVESRLEHSAQIWSCLERGPRVRLFQTLCPDMLSGVAR